MWWGMGGESSIEFMSVEKSRPGEGKVVRSGPLAAGTMGMSRPELLPKALSGSMTPPHPGSVLMSVAAAMT